MLQKLSPSMEREGDDEELEEVPPCVLFSLPSHTVFVLPLQCQ